MTAARAFLSVCLACLLAAPSRADTTEDARHELSGTMNALKGAAAREKQLEAKRASLERQLETLQQVMVKLARQKQEQEEALTAIEDKLTILEEQKKQKTEALTARQRELSSAVSAMVNLSEVPTGAVVAMPGKLDETLATARALNVVSHAVQEEAESLKAQIRELEALSSKITKERSVAATRAERLEEQQQELEAKLRERKTLQSQLGGREKEEREHVAQLTARSQDLQGLIDTLAKTERRHIWKHEEEHAAGETPHERAERGAHRAQHATGRMSGHLHFPAAGRIISHYGDSGAGAAFSKGIVIATRAEAGVVAPASGEVVFAGPFRDYGRIVIIRHGDDYHTLLSGMEKIECAPGQHLLEGEPIGVMGRRGASRLYVELRKDGKPVDPTPWFKG